MFFRLSADLLDLFDLLDSLDLLDPFDSLLLVLFRGGRRRGDVGVDPDLVVDPGDLSERHEGFGLFGLYPLFTLSMLLMVSLSMLLPTVLL